MTTLVSVLVSGVAALLVAELLLRWWIRRRDRWYPFVPGSRIHMLVDLDTVPRVEPEVRFEANRLGVRAERETPSDGDCFRLLVAGGSAAEGYLLDWPKSWAGAIETRLQTPEALGALKAKTLHVGSVGKSRTGAVGMNLIFERLLPHHPPLDAIVIMVGATDVVDWLEDGAPEKWVPPDVDESVLFPTNPAQSFGWHPKKLALVEQMRRLREIWLRPILRREKVGRTLVKVRNMRARAKEIITEVPHPAEMIERFEDHLRRALRRAKKHSRRVIVVRQPCFWKESYDEEEMAQFWSFGVGNPYHVEVTRYFDLQVVGETMELMNASAEKVAIEEGVEHLDLMPVVERSVSSYYDFLHFTPKGAAEVAEAVAETILQAGPSSRSSD